MLAPRAIKCVGNRHVFDIRTPEDKVMACCRCKERLAVVPDVDLDTTRMITFKMKRMINMKYG
jgi:hypothetical protein